MTLTTAPTLITERLRLRAHRRDDFDAYATLWANPDVVQHITGTPATPHESWSRLMRGMGMWAMLGYGYWVVEDLQSKSFLGELGLADFLREIEPPIAGIPEAGWVLAPEAQGKGMATEAMRAVMAWADANLDVPRTVCFMDQGFDASRNVALKLGFKDHAVTTFRDRPTLMMERLRDDC